MQHLCAHFAIQIFVCLIENKACLFYGVDDELIKDGEPSTFPPNYISMHLFFV